MLALTATQRPPQVASLSENKARKTRLEIESGCKLLVCLTETRLRKARNRERV